MVNALCLALSLAALTCAAARRPHRATCAPEFYANGIRPSGVYTCRRIPGGDPAFDGAGGAPDRTIDRPGWYVGRVYCTGGEHPVLYADGRSYGCQR
jgi:hypothetical protein